MKATRVPAVPVPPPPDTILLELTEQEARVLWLIGLRCGPVARAAHTDLVRLAPEDKFFTQAVLNTLCTLLDGAGVNPWR